MLCCPALQARPCAPTQEASPDQPLCWPIPWQLGVLSGYPTVGIAKNLLAFDGLDRHAVRASLAQVRRISLGVPRCVEHFTAMPRDPAKRRAANQRYTQSDKGRAAKQQYDQSGKRQAARGKRRGASGSARGSQDRSRGSRHRVREADGIPSNTKPTSGVVGLTVLQPKFLEQFPDARFHFKSGPLAQRGTFKGVWLNEEWTAWALERLEE
jgi:hypothetical protein